MLSENKKKRAVQLLRKAAMVCAAALFALVPATAEDTEEGTWEFDPEKEAISDKALEQFGIALTIFQQLQMEANGLISETVAASSLPEELFLEIHNTQISDPGAVSSSFNDDEIAAYNEAMEDITEIQGATQQQMAETVVSLGFAVEDFNDLSRQIQEDPQLYERLEQVFTQLQQGAS